MQIEYQCTIKPRAYKLHYAIHADSGASRGNKMDRQTYIRAQDNRAVIIDSDSDGVSVSVHTNGGHALCVLSHDAAVELLNVLRCIVGDSK